MCLNHVSFPYPRWIVIPPSNYVLPALPGEQPHLVRWDPPLMRRRHLVGIKLHLHIRRLAGLEKLPSLTEVSPTGVWLTVVQASTAEILHAIIIWNIATSASRIGLSNDFVHVLPRDSNFAEHAPYFAEATFCLLSDSVRLYGNVLSNETAPC